MKKINKLKLMVVIGLGFFLAYISTVFAAGSASLTIEGNSSVAEGENITLDLYVTNVTSDAGGVVSVGGFIKFNTTYLEYVSSDPASVPYLIQYQAANASTGSIKIAGIDNTMEAGITSKTRIISVTFKALKKGSTTVSFESGELTDTADILTGTFGSKTITINEPSATTDPDPEPQSSNANLSSLGVSGYNISPSFDPNVTEYTLTVPNDASSVTITATPADSKAGQPSGIGTKTLSEGVNEVAVVVTAEDGTKKTYIIRITKEVEQTEPTPTKSSDATLKSLDVSGYTLYPTFDKNTTTYNMSVQNTVSALNVSAIPTDEKANVSISGNSGWVVGVNVLKITVTAEDGTEKIYTVNVTRKPSEQETVKTTPKSSNNYLKELSTSSGDLSPVFNSNTSNYSITIPYDVNKLDLKALAVDSKSTVNIKGNENLKVGLNVIEVEVIAEDGSSRSYTINVTKSAKTANNKLTDLIISGTTSSAPKFNPDTYEYDVEISKNTKSLDIKPINNNSKATVEVTGNENLKEGNNVILIKVTDENGFIQYYKINAYKNVSSGSSIFNSNFPWWILLALLFLIPIIIILWLLSRKDNSDKTSSPTIEFKPEFNFSSKNGTDDDYVEAGGVLNQVSEKKDLKEIPNTSFDTDKYVAGTTPKLLEEQSREYETKEPPKVYEAKVEEIPYDPYDEVVTKDELIDAINEKDVAKLKILYEQEMLNREKEKVKEKEELKDAQNLSREEKNKNEEI